MVTNLDKIKAVGFLTVGLDTVKGNKTPLFSLRFPPKILNDIYVRGENIWRKMKSIGDIRNPGGTAVKSNLVGTRLPEGRPKE